MITDTNLNFFSVFIFLGVVQGFILSFFFIKNGGKKKVANIFQGILLLTLSMGMFEEFLNETGYIVQVLWLSDYSESFNFLFAPLFFLFIKRSLKPEFEKKDLLHFIVFLIWFGNMMFYFTEPNEFKYNNYIGAKHPDWQYLQVLPTHNQDPLGVGDYTNLFTALSFILYMFFSIRLLLLECRRYGVSLFKTENAKIRSLRNITIHFTLIIIIFIAVKLSYERDLGDHFISAYVSFMILSTGFRIINSSEYFKQTASFMDFPLTKYRKSALTEDDKVMILEKIELEMGMNKYYLNHMASLEDLAKIMKFGKHHVSQVINEKLGKNFFELLAEYRVEESKKILQADKENKITIENLADEVGYNSKSAFNNVFKKLTGKTPSEFRENG
jgi:AraC-like DNA-binding protein